MAAVVDQIGRTFYLRIGSGTVTSDFAAERTFVIPIEQWCAATGVAVDARQVREWIAGTLTLTSPFGAGWQGEARITARKDLSSPPPGFLPVAGLRRDQAATLSVVLEHR